jgi:acetyl-CoA carboxylase biotin carboxyl carrier protein
MDLRDRVDELAALMEEFSLQEGELKGSGWRVALKKPGKAPLPPAEAHLEHHDEPEHAVPHSSISAQPSAPVEEKPAGTPVNSPMTGIFYSASSPSAPPFVKPGDVVEAGQVVGLIEAMKVFNEIVAPMAGTVTQIVADNGQLVQPGEPLLFIS